MHVTQLWTRSLVGITVTLLGLFIPQLPAQKQAVTAAKPEDNLDRCMRGLSSCDVSRLRPDDIARLSEAARRKNVAACQSFATACDPTALSPEEQTRLKVAVRQRNLDRCLE